MDLMTETESQRFLNSLYINWLSTPKTDVLVVEFNTLLNKLTILLGYISFRGMLETLYITIMDQITLDTYFG